MNETSRSDWNPLPGVTGTFMGRDALAWGIQALGMQTRDRVLIPAFNCREVIRAFWGRFDVEFYDPRPDTVVAAAEIDRRLAARPAKLVLLIHYFGPLQPERAAIAEVCRSRGSLLVEDCAHAMLTPGAGDTGDLALYSYRKLAPVPDGGGFRWKPGMSLPAPAFRPRILADVLSGLIRLKLRLKVRSTKLSRAGLTAGGKSEKNPAPAVPAAGGLLPLSGYTNRRIRTLDWAAVVARRRADYAYWASLLKGRTELRPLFADLAPGVCPLGYVVRAPERDALRARLNAVGVAATVQWRLHDAVGPENSVSHQLSGELLSLPVGPEFDAAGRAGAEAVFRS